MKEHLACGHPAADVREDIVQQFQRSPVAEAARQGRTALADLRKGQQPDDAQWQAVEAATRSCGRRCTSPIAGGIPHAASGTADAELFRVALSNGDYAAVRLNGVNEPEAALTDEEKLNYRRFGISRRPAGLRSVSAEAAG
ncbi:hypothetical protein [Stutzerimonas xanthomarina]|uniref:hypothetical protein n=1 Tax=Stutzerimonas xanthomarina TaxID=271420 RepID=UPI003AA9C519